jgi:hypothetical protein
MNDWTANIRGPWTGAGTTADPYQALVVAVYHLGDYSQLGAAQAPNDPVTIQANPISAETLGLIHQDSRFTVLWQAEILPEE